MKKKNSNIFPLLTGILAGGLTIYFLKSDKGQQIIDLTLKKGESVKSTLVDNSKGIIETSQKAIDKAIVNTKETLSNFTDASKDAAITKIDLLDNGIQKAKTKIAAAVK